jgi:pimeloyl-ACP methyl ester carboxylesterase
MSSMRIEPLRDIEVAYRAAGLGARVILIHGLAQDSNMWAAQQRDLTHFSTFAYDLRGHGGTTLGEGAGTLPQLGGDLIAFLERFGSATCVGFSLGGTVALWAAAERPDLVKGVVGMATSSVVGRAAAAGLEERVAVCERGDPVAVRDILLNDTRVQLRRASERAEELVAARIAAIGDWQGYVNGASAMRWMHDHPLNEALLRIEVPVLVVSGEYDVVCPRRAAEIMLEHLPAAEYEEIPGAGHLLTDEAPEAVTAILRAWLGRHKEGDGGQ